MSESPDKKRWADEYLIDPLHGLTPAEDTGIGGSYAPGHGPKASISKQDTGTSASTNPFRRSRKSTDIGSSSPSSPTFPRDPTGNRTRTASNGSGTMSSARKEAFAGYPGSPHSPRRSVDSGPGSSPPPVSGNNKGGRPRRSSSLRERYPGDPSVRPLDQLTKEAKLAHRSPHLRKKHLPGSDTIDKLDDASLLGAYHHEGPYDAAGLARNNSSTMSPIAAVEATNREALRATPSENIRDAIERHRPLEGTSSIPPGMTDRFGRTFTYKEGLEEDMMRNGLPDGGAYRQYEGIKYLPEDLKGKGEPAYSLEKQLKDHKRASRNGNGQESNDVELIERPRRRTGERVDIDSGDEIGDLTQGFRDKVGFGVNESYLEPEPLADAPSSSKTANAVGTSTSAAESYGDWQKGHSKSGSLSGLRRKIGSLRKSSK